MKNNHESLNRQTRKTSLTTPRGRGFLHSIKTETVHYSDSQNEFEGVIAYNENIKEKRPVVLIAHAFGGQSKFEEKKAIELAKLGYVGFAIDIYGKGKRANSPQEAQQLMNELNTNRQLLLERMLSSLKKAREFELSDIENIGAIGFCFGGKCVLDLARSGEKLKGVVSFHGVYDKPNLNQELKINCSVLVLHGWDDPLAPPTALTELATELSNKTADWEINAYGHTGHAFTNPKAQSPERGIVYNEIAGKRAWNRMRMFFEEVFEK